MVGNGVTNLKYDALPARVESTYWHSIYNTKTYEAMKAAGCEYWKVRVG